MSKLIVKNVVDIRVLTEMLFAEFKDFSYDDLRKKLSVDVVEIKTPEFFYNCVLKFAVSKISPGFYDFENNDDDDDIDVENDTHVRLNSSRYKIANLGDFLICVQLFVDHKVHLMRAEKHKECLYDFLLLRGRLLDFYFAGEEN